jgi:hypothetical protein
MTPDGEDKYGFITFLTIADHAGRCIHRIADRDIDIYDMSDNQSKFFIIYWTIAANNNQT